MESLGHLLSGFAAALSWYYLLYAFVGCVLGSYGVYYVFTTWLDVLLPVGQFGF